MSDPIHADMNFWPADGPSILDASPTEMDMRAPRRRADGYSETHATPIYDARAALTAGADLGLETSGFQVFDAPTAVTDWFDTQQVMRIYHEECKALARSLLGATHTFTWDHLIREPEKQTVCGGTDGSTHTTGPRAGGGYIGAVHMDYTTHSTWHEYLHLHGVEEPKGARRVVALNFWRPICDVVEDHPLAVCDARTVEREKLQEVVVYGYGADNYSWHDIGISTYSVKASERQRWYYFPRMTRDEVLVIKSYDSQGVIGGTSPHASFEIPNAPPAAPRRSVELRVLSYVMGEQD
ncbi:MAG: hypothetical protein HKP27_04655 [Myxococcales bacterium]|nr:hypothetical protein [Myxococcales bacterium]